MIDPHKPHWLCVVAVAGVLAGGRASAAVPSVYCAHDATEFANDLADVSNGGTANGHDNIIHLVAGTFATGGTVFGFNSNSGYALSIDGGYDLNCVSQDLTPGATVLDGGGPGLGASEVLSLQSTGDLSVSRLTIQHGFVHGTGNGGGVGIYLGKATATARFDNNQVLANVSDYSHGGMDIFGGGTVYVDGNLFAGNSAPAGAAFALDMNAGSVIYLNNNTIVGNTNTSAGSSISSLGGGSADGYVSNNISYGNVGGDDFYLYSFQTFLFVDNDYHHTTGAQAPASHGNLDLDPLFVNAGNGNYRLAPGSPLRAKGTAAATGGLPAADLDGGIFPLTGKVDMGAWNEILFADGFDG